MKHTWGIIPAAGLGTRIQPLAFSKELLPVGTRHDGNTEHPRAVCEYLLERMLYAGADRLCFVISTSKTDVMTYFGGHFAEASICYTVQQNPKGLCDALFTALPFLSPEDEVLVGLPDTVWFPVEGFDLLPPGRLSFLLFPVAKPELFDAVVTDSFGSVVEIQVKTQNATSEWVWGAFRLTGRELSYLHQLWRRRGERDQYFGTLINAYLAEGGSALGVKGGDTYVDVGTLHGYREALKVLASNSSAYDEVRR